jgi:nucleoside-diphosphate-sugar epimerase
MEMRGKTALVTGATGFIGGRLSERLLSEEGVKVRALVRDLTKANALSWKGVELVQGDITDSASVRRAMAGGQLVFHCAAIMHDGTATREEFRRVNVGGTRNVLEAATDTGVERLIYVSSIAVYGISPKEATSEEDPYQPCGLSYCDTKIEAEELAFRSHRENGLPLVVIRPANVYGPRSSFWTVGLVMMIKSGALTLIDGGRGMSNHVYVDNLVDAMILAAKNDAAVGEAFIISDGARTPWTDFLAGYARMVGRDPLPSMSKSRAWLVGLMNELASHVTRKSPGLTRAIVGFWTQTGTFDISKARNVLGYEPRITLDEGMKLTEEWLREAGHLTD